jgi:hypothetical protein
METRGKSFLDKYVKELIEETKKREEIEDKVREKKRYTRKEKHKRNWKEQFNGRP